MDLVSLETQQENDYIQNWLDSRNLTYTWTSGRWGCKLLLPSSCNPRYFRKQMMLPGFATSTAATGPTCSRSVWRDGSGLGRTRRSPQPTRSMTGKRSPPQKSFFGRSLPNLFTHPPTPGILWDLGVRKVKFGSKRAIFGVIWFFFGKVFPN